MKNDFFVRAQPRVTLLEEAQKEEIHRSSLRLLQRNGGGMNISSDLGGVRIVPGDPEASVLFAKVKGEPLAPNLGRPMPLHYERLTAEEKQILRDWISEGAKNN